MSVRFRLVKDTESINVQMQTSANEAKFGFEDYRGPQGPVGPQGPAGPQGERGPRGIEGPAGQTGPRGEKGDQGERGPQGITGATGPAGAAGRTPQAGVDYFTQADKAEMINAVRQSLKEEVWTFELEDGSIVQKVVMIK
jgi:hypothetical protein